MITTGFLLELARESGVPEKVVRKVLKGLKEVTLKRALRGEKTIIPGICSIVPDTYGSKPTLKCVCSRNLKDRFRELKTAEKS